MASATRVRRLAEHIVPVNAASSVDVADEIDFTTVEVDPEVKTFNNNTFAMKNTRPSLPEDAIIQMLPKLDETLTDPECANAVAGRVLPGPLDEGDRMEVLKEIMLADQCGNSHLLWEKWMKAYGGAMSSNVVIPTVMPVRGGIPKVTNVILLAHPKDAERIGKTHVKKNPRFSTVFHESVISTCDNDSWMKQRDELNEAFMPISALCDVFPISVARAEVARQLLHKAAEDGNATINMHEFLMNEAQAQLQLAALGLSNEFMERTNKPLRDAYAGQNQDPEFMADYLKELVRTMHDQAKETIGAAEKIRTGRTELVRGPLSKIVAESGEDFMTQYGNANFISFAGHDTTGNTMTWCVRAVVDTTMHTNTA
jgi:cytochrome P450